MRKNSEIIAQHLAPWWAAAMKNLIYLLLIIALMVAGSAAQAQQSGKVFRVGFLERSAAAGSTGRLDGVPAGAEQGGMDRRKKHHHRVAVCGSTT